MQSWPHALNPLLPSVPYMAYLAKILILKEGIIKKFPMIDEKSLF